MEVLLTPVVNKILKRFIKSAEGRSGSSLRVSLSGDSVVLHNLELSVFAVLADRSVVGQTTAVIDIDLHPLICCISSQQVAWLRVFGQAIPTVLAARGEVPALAPLTTSHLVCKPRFRFANSSGLVRCPL